MDPDDGRPRIVGILETALYVADLERSRAFYQRLMGFDCFLLDSRMCALGVPGRGVLLLFLRHASKEPSRTPIGVIPAHDGMGALHMAFAIPADSLAAWEAQLESNGVQVESRITWPRGGTSLYFRDPDGHSLEVATPGLWPNDTTQPPGQGP
jgi:catechol 2,3-dioxygenase-like lactoylglutathione lyase family enzyme